MRFVTSFSGKAAASGFLVLTASLILAGCGTRAPKQEISGNFVPAGFQRPGSGGYAFSRDPRNMAAGDPNVSAAVKAHVIPGLPGGPQRLPAGGPAHP